MAMQYDNCPKCGSTIIKGAARCTRCGALLITAKEQEDRIKRLREGRKEPSAAGMIIKIVLFLAVICVIWYFFSDQITGFVRQLLNRLGL